MKKEAEVAEAATSRERRSPWELEGPEGPSPETAGEADPALAWTGPSGLHTGRVNPAALSRGVRWLLTAASGNPCGRLCCLHEDRRTRVWVTSTPRASEPGSTLSSARFSRVHKSRPNAKAAHSLSKRRDLGQGHSVRGSCWPDVTYDPHRTHLLWTQIKCKRDASSQEPPSSPTPRSRSPSAGAGGGEPPGAPRTLPRALSGCTVF